MLMSDKVTREYGLCRTIKILQKGAKMSKTVNYGDSYNHRISLRLNDRQFNFLIELARILGTTPSNYLRMCINSMVVEQENLSNREVGAHENVKTDIDNQL